MFRVTTRFRNFLFGKINLPLLTLLLFCTFTAISGKTSLQTPPSQVINNLVKAAQVARTNAVEEDILIKVHYNGII